METGQKTASLLWDWHKKGGCKDGKPLKMEMENGTFPQPDLHNQAMCLERNIHQPTNASPPLSESLSTEGPYSPGIVAWP